MRFKKAENDRSDSDRECRGDLPCYRSSERASSCWAGYCLLRRVQIIRLHLCYTRTDGGLIRFHME